MARAWKAKRIWGIDFPLVGARGRGKKGEGGKFLGSREPNENPLPIIPSGQNKTTTRQLMHMSAAHAVQATSAWLQEQTSRRGVAASDVHCCGDIEAAARVGAAVVLLELAQESVAILLAVLHAVACSSTNGPCSPGRFGPSTRVEAADTSGIEPKSQLAIPLEQLSMQSGKEMRHPRTSWTFCACQSR